MHLCILPYRQVAHHDRLARKLAQPHQRRMVDCGHIDLEDDGSMGKIDLLRPPRMQLAQPANDTAVQLQPGRTPRMKSGMRPGATGRASCMERVCQYA